MKAVRNSLFALLLFLVVLCLSTAVFAEESDSDCLLNDQQILQAVQPLVDAEEEFYDISSVTVDSAVQTLKEDGTADIFCFVRFDMCLKAKSVDGLPYVAGLLDEIGVETFSKCKQAVQSAMSVPDANRYSADTIAMYETTDFLNTVDECIGTNTEAYFGILINVSSDGTINEVLGAYDETATFPLSEYFPSTQEEMYQSGTEHADAIVKLAADMSDEIRKSFSAAITNAARIF